MIELRVTVDIAPAIAGLNRLARKQIPFATARAVTALAKIAVTDLQKAMTDKLDRPTRWTLNAFYAKPAKKADPTAYVASREFAGKGRPAWKYLHVQALGGSRAPKGMELKMSQLAGGQFVVPTANTPLDAYGNIQRGWMTQVLSRLSLMGENSVSPVRSARMRRMRRTVAASGHRGEYFIGRAGGSRTGIPLGVYRLIGKGVVQKVLAFTAVAPRYGARFNFEAIVAKSVAANQTSEMRKALAAAIATARK